jgi:hypothetical protein
MKLDEAYQAWGSQSDNRELYNKTKDMVRKAIWTLPANKPCEYYTLEVLGRAFAVCTLAPGDKIKAASVICHVLSYAHSVDPDRNPKPDFGYTELAHYNGKKSEKKEVTPPAPSPAPTEEQATESKPEPKPAPVAAPEPAPRKTTGKQVVQLDAKTLAVVKTWPSVHAARKELGIQNIQRAIDRHGLAGGCFWCRPGDEANFRPMDGRFNNGAKPKTDNIYQEAEPTLTDVTDEQLLAEIRRRGWRGRVIITRAVDLD